MKCVAYCRVSSDSDEQMNSLQNQIRHYTELFQKDGYEGAECGMYYSRENGKPLPKEIKSIFADEGISGTKLKHREAFKYMLECAYRKEFDVIYVKNIQRWARSVEDGAGILKKLKVIGVKVIFEDGNLNNFEHEMVINVLLSTSQEESRAKSVAVQFGIRKAQKDKKFISGTPYGYSKNGGYLKIIPEEAEVVKMIYNLYINEGWGGIRIARYLNENNYKTKKNRKWTQVQILDIINNDLYAGIQISHTVQNTDINVDSVKHVDEKSLLEYKYKSRKNVDPSEWITHEIDDIKIISNDMYEMIKEEKQRRNELYDKKIRRSTSHVFSNLIYCDCCDRALRRKKLCTWVRKDGSRKLKHEWVCTTYDQYHNDFCQYRNSWEEQKLLEEVKNKLEQAKTNKLMFDLLFQQYVETFLSTENVDDQIYSIKVELEDLKAESNVIRRLLSKGKIEEDQYEEENNTIQTKKKKLETQLYKYEQIENERLAAKRKYDKFLKKLNEYNINELGEHPTQDNLFLKSVISRIIAKVKNDSNGKERKHIEIVWVILDKSQYEILKKKFPISY